MSATNRRAGKRAKLDYYRTPDWAVDAVLPHLHLAGRILDPGCGDGAIASRLIEAGVNSANILGVEADAGRAKVARKLGITVHRGNFLRLPLVGRYDLVIGNPPYSLALEFIERAMLLAGPTATIAMLLRVNWTAGRCRSDWHRAHPSDLHVLERRPSFIGGGSDATDYGWFTWGPGRGGRWSILECAEAA